MKDEKKKDEKKKNKQKISDYRKKVEEKI